MSSSNESKHDDLATWQWLVAGDADEWLETFRTQPDDPIAWNRQLRKRGLSAEQTRLVLEQLTLRPIGARKFRNAHQMYFQRVLLEQATSEALAEYKAGRFSEAAAVVDICCGLGGDLISLGKIAAATGVDRSPVACELARANCAANQSSAHLVTGDATDFDLSGTQWLHIDPDRRVDGQRTTKTDYFSTDQGFLSGLIERVDNIGIKLAPATRIPEEWNASQKQWLGDRQECKQLMAWFGGLARFPGKRSAAAIDEDGSVLFEWIEQDRRPCHLAKQLGEVLYEPHPTIIAGRMTDSLAAEFNLEKLAVDVPYLTGPLIKRNVMTPYQILAHCRLDRRDVTDCLGRLDCGSLEIKKRGVDQDLIQRFSKIKLEGSEKRVLVLTRLQQKHIAIVCKRIGESFRSENKSSPTGRT